MPDISYTIEWPDRITGEIKLVRFDLYLADDFSNLSKVNQVYGIIPNEDKQILVVASDKKIWILPGGTVEDNETLLETLVREVFEETAIHIDLTKTKPFFYQKVYVQEGEEWVYKETHVRYTTAILKQEEFKGDPDGYITQHKFVDLKDIGEYLKWGQTTSFMQEHLPQRFE